MLRRTLLLGLLAVASVILVAPLVLSYQVDDLHETYVAALSRQPNIQVERSSFSRGWFNSESVIVLALADTLCSDPSCPRLRIASNIYHGPLPFGAYVQTGLSVRPVQGIAISRATLEVEDTAIRFDPALPPMIATTVVGLGGDQHVEVFWEGGETLITTAAGEARLVAEGVQAKFTHDAVGVQLTLGVSAPGMTLTAPGGLHIGFEGLEMGFAHEAGESMAMAFDATLARATVASGEDAPTRTLDQVEVESKTEMEQGLASTRATVSFEHFAARDGAYGPGLMALTADNLNYRVLARIREQMQGIGGDSVPPGMALLALLQIYQQNAAALLGPGPSLAIPELEVATPSGAVTGRFHLSVPSGTAGVDPALAEVARLIQADLTVGVPRALVENLVRARLERERAQRPSPPGAEAPPPVSDQAVATMIGGLVASDILVPESDGTRYRLALALREGRIYLNGEERLSLVAMISLFTQGG